MQQMPQAILLATGRYINSRGSNTGTAGYAAVDIPSENLISVIPQFQKVANNSIEEVAT